MQFIIHFFLQLHPIIKLQYFSLLRDSLTVMETQIEGTAENNTWVSYKLVSLAWKSSKKGGVGASLWSSLLWLQAALPPGVVHPAEFWRTFNTPVHSDMQFHYRLKYNEDWQLPKESSPHTLPHGQAANSTMEASWQNGLLLPAWQSLHELEFHRLAAFFLIRSSLPYQMNVLNCYLLKRHLSVIHLMKAEIWERKRET